ncbi:hypothetical protein [Cellulomonas dongxiuzhuiae]|uniref:DUF222 domain-containing protein n=1 Tax=Cellulomonas dongxiuzhuiae TaxID=2819979 RepID=A0ABX8GLV2_9CELL|nr:hypothetical protein [Cellulomonas dongxiuzhuiae]MBO3095853.1 hypothetical protein [Cellulomonas dongxiuzhuiae]QWC17159.1 hypothetical protein KKR89_06035 [Cellulomonas dongxiuzhuiae]
MPSTPSPRAASALFPPDTRTAPQAYTGYPRPTIYVPAEAIANMTAVDRTALTAKATDNLLTSTPGATEARDVWLAAREALGEARAALAATQGEHVEELRHDGTTQMRRDAIYDLIEPHEQAVRRAEAETVRAHRGYLTVVFAVDEATRTARADTAIDAVPAAHAAAVEALATLEQALAVRERGHALAGYPARQWHGERGHRLTHWSLSPVVPHRGFPDFALTRVIDDLRTIVNGFPAHVFETDDQEATA